MRIKFFFFILFSLPGMLAWACLNEHHISKWGRSTDDTSGMASLSFHKQHNAAEIELYISNLLQEVPETEEEKLANKNSIAVSYIKLGRLEQAEAILNELLRKYPGDYSVIINLGTLYELQGKNKLALEYIKKAIILNPESHGGSEWFHIKVLEFKLKNRPASEIPGTDILQLRTIKGIGVDIASQVSYQLAERIPFTPAPNLVMAKILQEYGDYLADSVSIKNAYVIYEIGMDYDRDGVLKLAGKRDALLPFFKKYEEAVPVTGNYYLDNIISTVKNNAGEITLSILDRTVGRIQEEIEKRERQRKRKIYFAIAAVVLLSIGGYFLYRRAKQKGEYS